MTLERAPLRQLDLVRLDETAARAVLALPHVDRWEVREWADLSSLEQALRDGEVCSPLSVFLTVDGPERVDVSAIRQLQSGDRHVRLVLVVAELDDVRYRDLLTLGFGHVERLPLPPWSPEQFLGDLRVFGSMFPGRPLGSRRELLEFTLPSVREAVPPLVRLLCEHCHALGHPNEFIRSQLPLVVDEAVTNAMHHGHGWDPDRTVKIVANLGFDGIELIVQDEGDGFQRNSVADLLSDDDRARPGGRGLFLMESLMDEVRYEDDGRTVILRKSLLDRKLAGAPTNGRR